MQVDVENDAGRSIEIGVAFKSLRGRKQDGFVGVMLEQPLNALQHCGVVIDHQNEFSIWHLTTSLTCPPTRLEGLKMCPIRISTLTQINCLAVPELEHRHEDRL